MFKSSHGFGTEGAAVLFGLFFNACTQTLATPYLELNDVANVSFDVGHFAPLLGTVAHRIAHGGQRDKGLNRNRSRAIFGPYVVQVGESQMTQETLAPDV